MEQSDAAGRADTTHDGLMSNYLRDITLTGLCLNGHEYVKRQLEEHGIANAALDNGVLSCADTKRLQALCDGLSAAKIEALLRKWLRLLPHPFCAGDRQAGYRNDLSSLQIELSLTRVPDRSDGRRGRHQTLSTTLTRISKRSSRPVARFGSLPPTFPACFASL